MLAMAENSPVAVVYCVHGFTVAPPLLMPPHAKITPLAWTALMDPVVKPGMVTAAPHVFDAMVYCCICEAESAVVLQQSVGHGDKKLNNEIIR